jgi:hypothetical protein
MVSEATRGAERDRWAARGPLNVTWPALDVPVWAKDLRLSVQIACLGVLFVGSRLKTRRKPRSAPKGALTMKIVAVDVFEKT